MNRRVVISGCSGGGKSKLLNELSQRSYAICEEPGRRIVAEELAAGGTVLPWIDPAAFARRAIAMARADHEAAAGHGGWIFFDRGIVDAASFLASLPGQSLHEDASSYRYHRRVFLAPPWPEIYRQDEGRRHGLADAIAEYDRLLRDYPALGYDVVIIPRLPVSERADFVLDQL